jgi:monoterpene epsilon-lactone hydrolase
VPSRRHQLLATVIPKVRRAGELVDEPTERARIEKRHERLEPGLPTRGIRGFSRRFAVVTEQLPAGFPAYSFSVRGTAPTRTVLYLHGGGFIGPIDPTQVRYVARLARALDARIVLPDYPLTPEHSWRDSHDAIVDLATRIASDGELIVAGDSAGGGVALAIAETMRDRGGPQPAKLLLISPWVDLTTSTPETAGLDAIDPWLFIGKVRVYAEWWAGAADDLARPEVSPALGNLAGLPPALMFCGTRDLLNPGCRLLARRAGEAGWPLTYVEEPDLIHVYPILPLIPEARRAWRRTVAFLAD